MVWASSTVMTPSLPTLPMASAMSAPMLLVLGRDGGDVGDLVLGLDLGGDREELVGDGLDGLLHAELEAHRRRAGGHVAQALADHGLGEHGRGGGAVTGDVVGLGGDLLGELRAEVLVGVAELDLTGDGDAVVGDGGGAELLVDDDVAATRAERHLDGVGEGVDAALEGAPGVLVERQDLAHAGVLRDFGCWGRTTSAREPTPPRGDGLPGADVPVLLLDDREDVAGGEDEVLLAAVLDLGAAVLAVDARRRRR